MPWTVTRSDECPTSKPWACVRDSNGTIEGCHSTEAAANRQRAALYAQEGSKQMLHKSFQVAEVKADAKTGEFVALVSVFGNVDSAGDRILPGAYTKTLAAWQKSGDPIPVILSHQWDNPMAHIGIARPQDVKQTPQGLVVKGTLDVGDNDVARQVHKLMQRRSLKEFSIGYKVPNGGEVIAEDGANDITEIELVEVGPTLKGANSQTQLVAIKSALESAPPRSEEELRRAAADIEREAAEEKIPENLPTPPDPELEAAKAELEALKAERDAPPPPRSEEELRRVAEAAAREQVAEKLPDEVTTATPEQPDAEQLAAELTSTKAELEALKALPVSPPDEDDLKRRSGQLDRERQSEGLPPAVTPPKEPDPELVAIRAELAALKAEMEAKPAPTEKELRQRSGKQHREQVEPKLPKQKQTSPGPEVDFPENEALKAMVLALRTEVEELKKPAPADEEDLQRRSAAVARERVEPKLPPPAPPEKPEEVVALEARLSEVTGEVETLKARLEVRSAEELRHETERLERIEQAKQLEDVPAPEVITPEQLEQTFAQIEAVSTGLERAQEQLAVRTEEQQRRDAQKLEQQRIQETLPEAKAEAKPDPVLEAAEARVEAISAELEAAQAKLAVKSEEELRRKADRLERERIQVDLPEGKTEPKPDPLLEASRVEVEMVTAELEEARRELAVRSEEQLKREVQKQEQRRIKEALPEAKTTPTADPALAASQAQIESMAAELEAAQQKLAVRSEEQLRRDVARREQERIKATLPEAKTTPPPNKELEAAKTEMAKMAEQLQHAKAQLEARTEAQLKRDSDRARRQMIEDKLPPGTPPEPQPDLAQLMSEKLAAMETQLQAVNEKLAEQAAKAEAQASYRARDPLRERSERTALEIQSGGVSLRKPPKTKQEPISEPLNEDNLRERSRAAMMEVLTGETHDQA